MNFTKNHLAAEVETKVNQNPAALKMKNRFIKSLLHSLIGVVGRNRFYFLIRKVMIRFVVAGL